MTRKRADTWDAADHETPADELQRLHDIAVKLAAQHEAATPGTQTKRVVEQRLIRAEEQFSDALRKHLAR